MHSHITGEDMDFIFFVAQTSKYSPEFAFSLFIPMLGIILFPHFLLHLHVSSKHRTASLLLF